MTTPKITFEQFELAMRYARSCSNTVPKKIKVTHNFYDYLVAKCSEEEVIYEKDDTLKGYYANFIGIPIEIDDTIENEYYKLVYEEELK